MKKLIAAAYFLTSLGGAIAQDSTAFQKDTSKITRPFQYSSVYPVGTNGIHAYKIRNVVSINSFVGVSGGVDAFEMAGFGNVTNGYVTGGQFAGFFNLNRGDVKGYQGAGFLNSVAGHTKGAQGAGFLNINTKTFKGLQASGFANYNGGTFSGAQFAGFHNHNNKEFKGVQASGFSNSNLKDMKGAQFAGFANAVVGDLQGSQWSGFVNIVTDTLKGAQVGFMNYAKRVKGLQIGFLNICDSISGGLPVGFFSFVKKGYHKAEVEFANNLYLNASFKTGVKKFYNIFTGGIMTNSNDFVYGVGYGVGTMFGIGPKLDFNIDLTATQMLKDDVWNEINLLNKLKLNVAYKLTNGISIYGGPSLDVLVHDISEESVIANPIKTWGQGNTLTKASVGFNAGIRF